MASETDLGEGASVLYERDFVVAKVLKPRGRQAESETPAAE